jgi:hypothetical protein
LGLPKTMCLSEAVSEVATRLTLILINIIANCEMMASYAWCFSKTSALSSLAPLKKFL